MGAVLTFPSRPFPRTADSQDFQRLAEADAFMASPRGRFIQACNVLQSLGYETTADDAAMAYRDGFGREALTPSPYHMGKAFAALSSIPPNDEPAARQARKALVALVAIAMPFNDEPGAA